MFSGIIEPSLHSITKVALGSAGVFKEIKKIAVRVSDVVMKNVFPHLIRHTTATNALQNGMPVEMVKEMLGHEKIDTTMVYAKVAKDDVQRFHTKCVL